METDEPALCPLPLPDDSDVLENSSKLQKCPVTKVESDQLVVDIAGRIL